MPQVIALATGALILIVAGFKNVSVVDVLQGKINPKESAFPNGSGTADTLSNAFGVPSTDAPTTGPTPSGLGHFDGHLVAAWIVPILQWARAHGWSGHVISGYRSTADQARVCATGVKPCATPGESEHQGINYPRGAVDVGGSWQELTNVLRNYPKHPTIINACGISDCNHFSATGH